jgi:hypothetical protein
MVGTAARPTESHAVEKSHRLSAFCHPDDGSVATGGMGLGQLRASEAGSGFATRTSASLQASDAGAPRRDSSPQWLRMTQRQKGRRN